MAQRAISIPYKPLSESNQQTYMYNLHLDKSLIQHIDEACEKYANRPCLIFEGETFTFKEVQDASCKVANQLIVSGFKKDMRGAVFSLNSHLAYFALLGIIRAGGIWVPINPRNSLEDNITLLKNFGCDAIFFQDIYEKGVGKIAAEFPNLISKVCLNKTLESSPSLDIWIKEASQVPPNVPTKPTDIVCIPMTGGTTGLPKAVALSNRNFAAILYNVTNSLTKRIDIPVGLLAAPMTHVGGRLVLCLMYAGGRHVVLPTMSYDGLFDNIPKYGVTTMFLPPTAIYKVLEHPRVHTTDFSSLDAIGYGAAPMDTDKLKEAIRVIGPCFLGGYGQTESPMCITSLEVEDHFKDGVIGGKLVSDERLKSCGNKTLVSEIAIMDEMGNLLPAGELGEIVIKGPFVSEGYFMNPAATAKIRKNGWHLSGDIGKMDGEGYLYILDRKKDMIITGGFNVYSIQVERAVAELDGVAEVACFGIPHKKWGEAVHVNVILEKEANLTEETIINYCKEKIGPINAPKSVQFVQEFARNSNGKVVKRKMRAAFWKGQEKKI